MNRSVQWLNENSYRTYPFVPGSSLQAGSITIPDSAILDVSGIVYNVPEQKLYLRHLEIIGGIVPVGYFNFIYPSPGWDFNVSVPANAAWPYTGIQASSQLGLLAQRVSVVFGSSVADLLANTPGIYTLDTPAEVEPALLSFHRSQRVNRIIGGQSVGPNIEADGLIKLVEGYNCEIRTSETSNTITVSAVRGAGAGVDCAQVYPSGATCKTSLLTINGFHGDDNGNFELIAGEGVSILRGPDMDPPEPGVLRIISSKKNTEMGCG